LLVGTKLSTPKIGVNPSVETVWHWHTCSVLTNYPKSFKLAPARLKKGMALIEQGQKQSGVRELREIVKRYPGTEEERRARAKLKELGVATTAAG